MNTDLERAAQCLLGGGLVIYPTETLYALGAVALNHEAQQRLNALKGRPSCKPLPVIIGSREQLDQITSGHEPGLDRLVKVFWPGPLSILLPAAAHLPIAIQDDQGFVAVRWTPHPVAQGLAQACKAPLIATSANFSGQPAVHHPEKLDRQLVHDVDFFLRSPPFPAGGKPSTVVRLLASNTLEVLRPGVITAQALMLQGWAVRTKNYT